MLGAEGELPHADVGGDDVDSLIADSEDGVDLVEVGIIGTPQVDVGHGSGELEEGLLSRREGLWIGLEGGDLVAIAIDDDGGAGDFLLGLVGVDGFGFDGEIAGLFQGIEIGGIDISADGAEVEIERIGLVDGIGDVKDDVAVEAAEVGVEGFTERKAWRCCRRKL